MSHEKVSYMMMFCALLLVREARAGLEESLALLPQDSPAKELAQQLVDAAGSRPSALGVRRASAIRPNPEF